MKIFKTIGGTQSYNNVMYFEIHNTNQTKITQIASDGVYVNIIDDLKIKESFVLKSSDLQKVYSIMKNPTIKENSSSVVFKEGEQKIKLKKVNVDSNDVAKIDLSGNGFEDIPTDFIDVINEASTYATDTSDQRVIGIAIVDKKIVATNRFVAYTRTFPGISLDNVVLRNDTFKTFSNPTKFKLQNDNLYLANDDFTKIAYIRLINVDIESRKGVLKAFDKVFQDQEGNDIRGKISDIEWDCSDLGSALNNAINLNAKSVIISNDNIKSFDEFNNGNDSEVIPYESKINIKIDKELIFDARFLRQISEEGQLYITEGIFYGILIITDKDQRLLFRKRGQSDWEEKLNKK